MKFRKVKFTTIHASPSVSIQRPVLRASMDSFHLPELHNGPDRHLHVPSRLAQHAMARLVWARDQPMVSQCIIACLDRTSC